METEITIENIQNSKPKSLSILLVAENVSKKMGGESGKNLYYLQLLQERNVDVWIVCHARVKNELRQELSEREFNKITFIEDTKLQVFLWQISKKFHYRIQDLIFGQLLHLITQFQARKVAKKIIKEQKIQLIFEPSPITPKGLSFMYNMDVPVVIGPLSGGLEFPPAFQYMDSAFSRISVKIGRFLSDWANILIPGKLQADTLIVANKLTEKALPKGCQGKIYHQILECGVDLEIWQPRQSQPTGNQATRFVYVGRFVDWKGVEFLLKAFQQVMEKTNSFLELIGDGELRNSLESLAEKLGIKENIKFHGWLKREDCQKIVCECDVFVMPSLREAGGNAILEAMALGLPIIATNWAGPAITVDSSCGILVEPSSKQDFIDGLAEAMIRLANADNKLRLAMGEAGIKRVRTNYFDWDSKCDAIIDIFQETLKPLS